MRRQASSPRAVLGAAAGVIALLAFPSFGFAHGVSARSDLPLPSWLLGWGAALVLIISFLGLATLWPRPKLERSSWRPLPAGLGRVLGSRVVEIACGVVGVVLFSVTIASGLVGEQIATANFAPTFVYVAFFVGLVPVSVLFGDVFRAFNPWRAIGRATDWLAARLLPRPPPPPRPYPERLGRWPAVVGIFLFAWLELVVPGSDAPRTVAIAACVYSSITSVGTAIYGVGPWIERAEAFSVYFNLFSRLSPFERREREVGLRRPLSGLAKLEPQPGTVVLIAVMIGTVSFDGASEGALWQQVSVDLAGFLESVGLGTSLSLTIANTLGVLFLVLLIYVLYRLAVTGAGTVGGVSAPPALHAPSCTRWCPSRLHTWRRTT